MLVSRTSMNVAIDTAIAMNQGFTFGLATGRPGSAGPALIEAASPPSRPRGPERIPDRARSRLRPGVVRPDFLSPPLDIPRLRGYLRDHRRSLASGAASNGHAPRGQSYPEGVRRPIPSTAIFP